MSRVLVIGDLHLPAVHPRYLDFVRDLRDYWKVNRVVFIGDVVDHHNISFHPREVDAYSVDYEFELVEEMIHEDWYPEFTDSDNIEGNHDRRIERLAASVNIPKRAIVGSSKLWGTPRWKWTPSITIDGVKYVHGDGYGGQTPALNGAKNEMVSMVMGHNHTKGGFQWAVSDTTRIFGMDVGCGVDTKHPVMRYSQHNPKKPFIGAGVVIDGQPFHFAMPCGPGEKYRRKDKR